MPQSGHAFLSTRIRHGLRLSPLLLLSLTACQTDSISFLHPAGTIAALQREWLIEIVIALAVIIIPVFVGVAFCLWRYRLGNRNAAFTPDWSFALPLEFLVWGVPATIVIILSLLIAGSETRHSPERQIGTAQPLDIQVVALNWKWLFIYPDQHVASLDTLVLPVGREVRFLLTSDKTMQSFFIPSLGSQIYAMAGMVTHLHLLANRPGHYLGENTQFNGMGFQGEKFTALALLPDQFTQWTQHARTSPVTLNDETYRKLLKDGDDRQAMADLDVKADTPDPMQPQGLSFSNVSDDLFRNIVSRYHGTSAHQGSMPQ